MTEQSHAEPNVDQTGADLTAAITSGETCLVIGRKISSAGLAILPDLHLAGSAGLPVIRRRIAPPAGATAGVRLIAGTERFAAPWLPTWLAERVGDITHDAAAYSMLDARVAGDGWIWLQDRLVTAPEVMPAYVAKRLDIAHGGHADLHRAAALPVRPIGTPCLVAVGHGTGVYGHFLIEMLFRILVTRAAFRETGLRYHLLLDCAAPAWLLRILNDHLGIPPSQIEFFDPMVEQVRLRHAIVPSLLWQAGGFHPLANDMLAFVLADLDLPDSGHPAKRIFVTRGSFSNPASAYRRCHNEEALVAIAARRHGFTPVTVEAMSWPQQIATFRDAEMILGLTGSGLHNALFSPPGSALASIGWINGTQAEIGHLRRQHIAFLDGIPTAGDFVVDETRFTAFLDAVCDGWPPPPPPVQW